MANQVDYRDPTPNKFPQDYDPAKVDSRVKLRSDSIKHKQMGVDAREAIYQGLEIGAVTAGEAKAIANDTANRQDQTEKIVNEGIGAFTEDSEVKIARDGHDNLLAKEKSQDVKITNIRDRITNIDLVNNRVPLTDKLGIHAWANSLRDDNWQHSNASNKLIRETGFKYIRVGVLWSWIDKHDGTFDWTTSDKDINSALDAGLIPIVYFETGDIYNFDSFEALMSALKLYITAVVTRYSDKGIVWEGWNELNITSRWDFFNVKKNSDAEKNIVELNNLIGNMVRIHDSTAVYLPGSLATADWLRDADFDWNMHINNLYSAGLANIGQYVSQHPYTQLIPESLLGYKSGINSLNEMQHRHTYSSKPTVVTEFGYSTTGGFDEKQQADYLARSMFIMDLMGLPLITLFQWRDSPREEQQNNAEDGYGIVKDDLRTYKPSGQLITSLITQLEGYWLIGRIKTDDDNYVLSYTNGNGYRLVYWTTDDTNNHKLAIGELVLDLNQTPNILGIERLPSTQYMFNNNKPDQGAGRLISDNTYTALVGNNNLLRVRIYDFTECQKIILTFKMKDVSDGSNPGSRTGTYMTGLPHADDGSIIFNIICDQVQNEYRTFMINTNGDLQSWTSNIITSKSTMTASYSYTVPK